MIGPPSLAPGLAPGGLVIRVYAPGHRAGWDGGRLVVDTALPGEPYARDAAAVELAAYEDAAAACAATDGPLVLVVYDGDTGERWPRPGMAWPTEP